MEVLFWQLMTGVCLLTAILALAAMASIMFADHATYRRGR